MAVGFDEKSADVRIAQYESGTRTPKQALVEQLAEALDVIIWIPFSVSTLGLQHRFTQTSALDRMVALIALF